MKEIIKQVIKVFFILTFIAIIVILGLGTWIYFSLTRDKNNIYESEYFIYAIIESKNGILIQGLTDLGKEQEYLIIPETIDGKKVRYISETIFDVYRTERNYGNLGDISLNSEKLEKVFIVSGIGIINAWVSSGLFSRKEVFYISNADVEFTNKFYRTSLKGDTAWHSLTAANVSYDYNYENSLNYGYYWIDNYNYGENIEFIPPEPTREGYTFAGWYKESECINKWNFETDTLPQAQYDENDRKIYQETKLYAKWI